MKNSIEDLDKILGLPQECNLFLDKKKRTAYPITMKDFKKFINNFTLINTEKLWSNMIFDENINAVKNVLSMSFKDDDIDDILENINARNFKEIFKLIMDINGIEFKKDDPKNKVEV